MSHSLLSPSMCCPLPPFPSSREMGVFWTGSAMLVRRTWLWDPPRTPESLCILMFRQFLGRHTVFLCRWMEHKLETQGHGEEGLPRESLTQVCTCARPGYKGLGTREKSQAQKFLQIRAASGFLLALAKACLIYCRSHLDLLIDMWSTTFSILDLRFTLFLLQGRCCGVPYSPRTQVLEDVSLSLFFSSSRQGFSV